MIVKNESKIIYRCLESVMGVVDYICVCDTGSTDDTVDIIKTFCENQKNHGKLLGYSIFHHPWENFGVNRTWAVHACQKWLLEYIFNTTTDNGDDDDKKSTNKGGDDDDDDGPEGFLQDDKPCERNISKSYDKMPGFVVPCISPKSKLTALKNIVVLFLDADMKFWVHTGMTETDFRQLNDTEKMNIHQICTENAAVMTSWKLALARNNITLVYQYGTHIIYPNIRFLRGDAWIQCHGPTHEYYTASDLLTDLNIEKKILTRDCSIEDVGDGGSKADKYIRDIRLLKDAIRSDPKNHRYWFYLGNSYKNSGAFRDAIDAYKKRIDMQGWVEEIFMSYLYMGECYELLDDRASALFAYMQGFHVLPTRSETLYRACVLTRKMGLHHVSRMLAVQGKKIPLPTYPALFLETQVYNYLFDEEISIYSWYIHDYDTGRKACEKIIQNPHIDSARKDLAKSNLKFYTGKS